MIDALNNNALNGLEVALYHRDSSICLVNNYRFETPRELHSAC